MAGWTSAAQQTPQQMHNVSCQTVEENRRTNSLAAIVCQPACDGQALALVFKHHNWQGCQRGFQRLRAGPRLAMLGYAGQAGAARIWPCLRASLPAYWSDPYQILRIFEAQRSPCRCCCSLLLAMLCCELAALACRYCPRLHRQARSAPIWPCSRASDGEAIALVPCQHDWQLGTCRC